jgi:hypothetical protein
MAGTNSILQFAGDAGALVLSDGAYSSDGQRTVGNQPGIARANFVNKALRQSSYMAAVVAQFIANNANANVSDGDSVATAVANLITAIQLTSGFAAGTKVLFFQAAAPTYWTQDTLNNDKALRVVSGAGGGGGGTHNLSSPPSTDHVHTGPSHNHTTGDHTLTAAEMPSHTHAQATSASGGDKTMEYGGSASHTGSQTGPAGGDGAHNHGATGLSGTGSTGIGSPTAFAPKYIDVIVCSKN